VEGLELRDDRGQLSIVSGERKLIADIPDDHNNSGTTIRLSPDGQRVLATSSRYGASFFGQVWIDGQLRHSIEDDTTACEWLDSDRLIGFNDQQVFVCKFDGSDRRQIFPAP